MMGSNATDDQVQVQPRATESMETAHTNENSKVVDLHIQHSVKAGGLESSHKDDGAYSAEVAAGEIPVSGNSANANRGADSTNSANGEPSGGQPSDDIGVDGSNLRNKTKKSTKQGRIAPAYIDSQDYTSAESEDDVIRDVYLDTHGRGDSLAKRIKKAPKRAVQQMAYTRLLEDRMRDIEARLQVVENKKSENDPSSAAPDEKDGPADLILAIKRMSFHEYLPVDPNQGSREIGFARVEHKRRHRFPRQGPYHIIDVVDSASHQPERPRKVYSSNPTADSRNLMTPGLAAAAQDPLTSAEQAVQPERIRINSSLLLEALEAITGQSFTKSCSQDGKPHSLYSQVILRPFKLLVTYEQKIRDELSRLEKIHHHANDESKGEASKQAENERRTLPQQPLTDTIPGMSGQDKSDEPQDYAYRNKTTTDDPVDRKMEDLGPLESRRCLEEWRILVEVLDKDLEPTFNLRKQIKNGVAHSIAFQDLWHLYPLGDEIVSNDPSGENQVYRILNVCGGRPFLCSRKEADMDDFEPVMNARDLPKFDILGYFYDSDGNDSGACEQVISIKWYDGNKAITSLLCYPLIYSKNPRGLKPRDFFIERGKRYVELTRKTDVVHKRYNGLTLVMDELREEVRQISDNMETVRLTFINQVDSEVIIDVNMALLKNSLNVSFGVTRELEPDQRESLEFLDSGCAREACCHNIPIHNDFTIDKERNKELLKSKGFLRDFLDFDSNLSEQDYLVCPCWVYGYALRSRKWVKLEVSLVKDIDDVNESKSGFDSLVLPDGHKETLLALVQTHSKTKTLQIGLNAENRQMDLVRGKGKGLIILLHGEPGVGKSSTAESVAEYTRRPLFQVTCGDIGQTADEVERKLENHFQLAHKWGCVLLLDEADVFLEARSKTDLKRNSIVSVFLRILEYYSGILFLTTNRVGAFDQAFRSRIHMSLFYPKIDETATSQIWEMNVDRAREIWGDKLIIDDKDRAAILNFSKKHFQELKNSENTWNGRQIRNAFQTAIALAEWDAHTAELKYNSKAGSLKPRLEWKQFERVAKASKHFDAYLKEAQAGSAADLASENRERKDSFDWKRHS